jgi:hypothetical protein
MAIPIAAYLLAFSDVRGEYRNIDGKKTCSAASFCVFLAVHQSARERLWMSQIIQLGNKGSGIAPHKIN